MREILFRGKRIDNGEWVYGNLIINKRLIETAYKISSQEGIDSGKSYIFSVDPKSIGQFTGLTDKNGKKIFEGDIVSIYTPCNEKHNIGVIRFVYYASGIPAIFKTNLGFYIEWASEDNINRIDFAFWIQVYQDETEVIGNIHDNPKLLEVTE